MGALLRGTGGAASATNPTLSSPVYVAATAPAGSFSQLSSEPASQSAVGQDGNGQQQAKRPIGKYRKTWAPHSGYWWCC